MIRRGFPDLILLFGILLVGMIAAPATAQVERIELDIAGYLCGF